LGNAEPDESTGERRNQAGVESRALGDDRGPLGLSIHGKGDCKIYALQKRKLLIEKGFPRQALLMTIVRDHDNQGHAVLTAKTNRGDFVLDNLTDDIIPWAATGYRFVKRQSQEDPNIWVAIEYPNAPRQISSRSADAPQMSVTPYHGAPPHARSSTIPP
jgi:hypothetical protein